jgi:hypothetical protein
MFWWSYAVGLVTGIALTPVTYRIAELWWTRRYRRQIGDEGWIRNE